ncbi:MAG: DEAD/DEAH box helicase family protein [Acidaminococcaceae bacterium]|nr:DEAD/DEAH box helicase family protein [Acidaminococcaceae bacterium]
MPDYTVTNLCEDKDNYDARCVFSTYQTMMNCIDNVRDDDGKVFSCGHFDLVICDEAHRSIYNKYKDIFSYFDAPLIGLTATPKDDIDKNTYEIFELENGVPTYGYELKQAVKDKYLVNFVSIETVLKFLQDGISYDELSEEDKSEYENTFADDEGNIPDNIASSALNEWLFNEDTIIKVLDTLMQKGIKIDYGDKIGKTIIFAKNHNHAEKILAVFNRQYPHLKGYAEVIDNKINYAQTLIDQFSDAGKLPQIAISVDMLDTGIDVPEVLNLVFFKKVMSKAKFWQMIGRGTRLCKGLLDGEDKKNFYIFDFCGNFEFFRLHSKGKQAENGLSLAGQIFYLKAQIVLKLQDIDYQIEELQKFRNLLVSQMADKVRELNRDNFAVRQHLRYVDKFANADNYKLLCYADLQVFEEELAPLVLPDDYDAKAIRFDGLMYGIELAYLMGNKYSRGRSDLRNKVLAVAKIANIPEVKAQSDLINKILHTDYLERADINEFENIRQKIRDLIKYIPVTELRFDTNFEDQIIQQVVHESEFENDYLKNYKAKAEYYIQQHTNNAVVVKLKNNLPLQIDDIKELEKILWNEIGSKSDYEAEFGTKPLGEFVREIVGLDINAANQAFAKYLNDVNLDKNQIYFVKQIVDYIVHNGLLKDFNVLRERPFTDCGSIVEIFGNNEVLWDGIRSVIETINANAIAV